MMDCCGNWDVNDSVIAGIYCYLLGHRALIFWRSWWFCADCFCIDASVRPFRCLPVGALLYQHLRFARLAWLLARVRRIPWVSNILAKVRVPLRPRRVRFHGVVSLGLGLARFDNVIEPASSLGRDS